MMGGGKMLMQVTAISLMRQFVSDIIVLPAISVVDGRELDGKNVHQDR